jgi:hypothetical protein
MSRISLIIIALIFIQFSNPNKVNAQIDDLGSFMAAGPEDAEELLTAYISPWINGLGASLSGGWYNTAKTHKPGGFDVTITGNITYVPSEYKTFDVNELELNGLILADGEPSNSPTIAGVDEQGPQLNYSDYPTLKAFDLPPGSNIGYAALPVGQISIGLFKDTEISGRLLPKLAIEDDYDIGLWGVGLKHGLKQWIPGIKKIPFLHLTLQGGYTRLTANAKLFVDPATIGLEVYNTENIPAETWENQNLMIEISSITANLVVSTDFPFVSFYGGLGFVNSVSILKMEGYYPLLSVTETGPVVVQSEEDPINIQIKNQDGGVTKPRFNVGMRFKFAFYTMHFDYTRANFNAITAGIGFTFR